jgi:hypothetical protein
MKCHNEIIIAKKCISYLQQNLDPDSAPEVNDTFDHNEEELREQVHVEVQRKLVLVEKLLR